MKTVNYDAIKEHVSTQFGDLTGVIQIDGHSNITSIYELCKDHKFDTSDKFIIGFGLGESTTDGIGRRNQVTCSVLYVEKAEYGNNFEEIEAKIKGDGTLRLMKKNIYVNYSELGKYIKRYDFIATSELTKYVATIEINEDESEE
jgi:hypothetical protein